METYENRIVNGLLKAAAVDDPEQAADLLSRDIEIIVNPGRATDDDLWPCIWSVAAVLERQFSGNIYIRAGLTHALRQPAQLSSRCRFVNARSSHRAIRIGLGCLTPGEQVDLSGDTRGGKIRIGSHLESSGRPATPAGCFALAGYLGFAALASACGIPAHREDFTVPELALSLPDNAPFALPEGTLEFVGLGHLGHAYLALLFFLERYIVRIPRIRLVDKDVFELPNWPTQILIETQTEWVGVSKADYLERRLRTWGWNALGEVQKVNWGWQRLGSDSEVVIMGLDRFEVRRMTMAGGYSWVFEAGLGDSFLTPRVSWHSIPASPELGKRLFSEKENQTTPMRQKTTPFIERLRETPGGCGFLTYQGTQASAPSLGLVGSAFLWTEILRFASGLAEQIQGSATVWSPIIPPLRTLIA